MNGSQDSVQSIFITGAASGIGRETALLFARRGWRVGATDLDEARVQALAGEIGEERCLAARLDVRDAAAWTGGRMDALFNCAGVMAMGPFETVPVETHVRTVEVNVIGVLQGIHA